MLKRAVSDSRRLSELKSDSARLLWTWILPYLDIEGRYFADADIIKGKIVPRIKTFTPEIISEYLDDMRRVGLIVLYEFDGEKYLQFRNFHEFQNLRENREGKSKIPPPAENSRRTPGVLLDNDGNTPTQVKLREVKLREANAREEETPPSVDNPKKEALIKKEPDTLLSDLKEIIEDIGSKITEPRKQREVMLFIESNIKTKNHAAMMCCIKSLQKQLQNGIKIEAPKQYLEAALKIEEGKHNARDYEETVKEFKKPGMMSLGQIMAGIEGRQNP